MSAPRQGGFGSFAGVVGVPQQVWRLRRVARPAGGGGASSGRPAPRREATLGFTGVAGVILNGSDPINSRRGKTISLTVSRKNKTMKFKYDEILAWDHQ